MPRLASTAQLQEYLDLKSSGNVSLLTSLLDAAEGFAERYTGRRFSPDPALDTDPEVTKVVRLGSTRLVRVPDVRSASAVMVGGGAVEYELLTDGDEPATHLRLSPWVSRLAFTSTDLTITGRFGFAEPPPEVVDAVLTLASRAYRERDAQYADTVATADGGGFAYMRVMPARVKAMLDSYRVPRMAVV